MSCIDCEYCDKKGWCFLFDKAICNVAGWNEEKDYCTKFELRDKE